MINIMKKLKEIKIKEYNIIPENNLFHIRHE